MKEFTTILGFLLIAGTLPGAESVRNWFFDFSQGTTTEDYQYFDPAGNLGLELTMHHDGSYQNDFSEFVTITTAPNLPLDGTNRTMKMVWKIIDGEITGLAYDESGEQADTKMIFHVIDDHTVRFELHTPNGVVGGGTSVLTDREVHSEEKHYAPDGSIAFTAKGVLKRANK